MQSLAILGGTFDPIHYGHLKLARAAMEARLADRVLLMPSGKPPHKRALASSQDRLAMTMLAAYGMEGVDVSPLESTALTVSYTAQTLERLRGLYPDAKLYLILGDDAAALLPKWKDPEKVRRLCAGILAAPRQGAAPVENEVFGIPVQRMNVELSDEASSRIRAGAGNVGELTPVKDYIEQHGLYGSQGCELTKRLKGSMPAARYQHTLSVATTAVCLAYIHRADPWKAHLAGLLHDCAKGLRMEEQYAWLEKGRIPVDEEERAIPAIVHAPAGVAVARAVYGVEDEEILSAIRWHTTGRKSMTKLDKVIYLADMIEPLRRPFPGLTRIRQIAYRDLDGAVALAARISADHILSCGREMLRRTLEMLEEDQNNTEQ